MSVPREVWTLLENDLLTISIENGDGTYISPPFRTEIYCQNIEINGKFVASKKGQPGAPAEDINVIPNGISIRMTSFYEKKLTQWKLDRTKKFRLEFSLRNRWYDGNSAHNNENDDHVFRNCSVTDQKITGQDNSVIQVSLGFEAEYEE